jgi:hypothetical protein
MQNTIETDSSPRAADLESTLCKQGFRPGFPPRITRMSLAAADLTAARRMRCPICKIRFEGTRPFHKPGGYKVLAVCPCGCGEEV